MLPLPSIPYGEDQGNSNTIFPLESDDIEAPFALHKDDRSCTQHPISKFVLYSHLSPSYKAFIWKISSSIPNHFQDALTYPNMESSHK